MTTLHADRRRRSSARPRRSRRSRRCASTRTSPTGCGSRSPSARRRWWSSAGGAARSPVAADGTLLDRRRGRRGRATCRCSRSARLAAAAHARGRALEQALVARRRPAAAAAADRGGRVSTTTTGSRSTLRGGIPVRFGSGSTRRREMGGGRGRARRPEARRAHLPRRPGAGAARGRRAGQRPNTRPSSSGRDFREYVNPRARIEGLPTARFHAGLGDRRLTRDATMPYRRPHV